MAALDLGYMLGLVPVILRYVPLTLGMAIAAMVMALVLASVLAVIRVLKVPVVDAVVGVFISFFRGTPLLVQLFLFYYGLPQIVSALTQINGVTAAIMGLTLHFSAYMAESIRGAITGVDRSQWEAAASVGMTRLQAMRRIVLPQAARVAAPTLLNYFIDMIKSTSLAFTLGVTEMMGAAQKEAAGSFRYFEAFLVVAIVYWVIVEALGGGAAADGDAAASGVRAMIRIEGLSKRFGPTTVLAGIDLEIARGRAGGDHRAVGHRQVDAAPLHQLPRPADDRADHRRRGDGRRRELPAARRAGAAPAHRLRVPELRALRQQDGAGEHLRGARHRAGQAGRPRRGRGPTRSSPRSGSPTGATPIRRRSRAGSSSGSASAGRWRSTPS